MKHKYAVGTPVVIVKNRAGGYCVGIECTIVSYSKGDGHHRFGPVYKLHRDGGSMGYTMYHYESDFQPLQPQMKLFGEDK